MRYSTTVLIVAFAAMLLGEQQAMPQGGKVVTTRLTSPALEGHRPDRQARVYLPPSYEASGKRYPVAYYLHGANQSNNEFFSSLVNGRQAADQLIMNGEMEEMIIVGVDGTPLSSYVNSELNGNYEDYIARDLVTHIDASFRTIARRDSRGIFGGSMGGYGSLLYAMKYADVFGASYSHSGGPLGFSLPGTWMYLGGDTAVFADFPNAGSDLGAVKTTSDIQGILRGLTFAWARAFSPNLDEPPLFVDLPFELPGLEIIPEIREKWYQHDPFDLLDEHATDLLSLRGLALDVGDRDGNRIHMEAFHQKLLDAGVPHQFEVYPGGHADKRDERVFVSLQFLSHSLATLFGDVNGDDVLDAQDIDLLSAEIRRGTNDQGLDLTGDRVVDEQDLQLWVNDGEIAFTYFGDSNLDGEFNSGDLISVFQAGEYEDGVRLNSGWATGDWNGDAEFDSGDLVSAFQDGGYEQGPRKTVGAVPEPSCTILLGIGMIGVCRWRKRR